VRVGVMTRPGIKLRTRQDYVAVAVSELPWTNVLDWIVLSLSTY
jgi:hypothetical protein